MRIDAGARTDVGRLRQNNEDAFRLEPSLDLYILSDGLGGQASGGIASAMAVETIAQYCIDRAGHPAEPPPAGVKAGLSGRTVRLAAAAAYANRKIFDAGAGDPVLQGMGATVVAVWIEGRRAGVVHVGDSRAYRLRSASFEQLTADHSVVAEQVRLGILTPEQAATSSLQNVLLRALGTMPEVQIDADECDLQEGDTLLLCSDGLTHMAGDAEIAGVLRAGAPAEIAAARLVDLANEKGGTDNITVIVLRVLSGS